VDIWFFSGFQVSGIRVQWWSGVGRVWGVGCRDGFQMVEWCWVYNPYPLCWSCWEGGQFPPNHLFPFPKGKGELPAWNV